MTDMSTTFFVDGDEAPPPKVSVKKIKAVAPKVRKLKPAEFCVWATRLDGQGRSYVAKRFIIGDGATYSEQYAAAYDFKIGYEATYPEVCDVVYYGVR